MENLCLLVGGIPTPLKNMEVNWDDEIPNIWENRECSKPPTSLNTFKSPIFMGKLAFSNSLLGFKIHHAMNVKTHYFNG